MGNQESTKNVVGLMSGTSLDGIDAALVTIGDHEGEIDLKLIKFTTLPFTEVVRDKILQLCNPNEARIEDFSAMNMLLGELFADAAQKVVDEAGMSMKEIDLISSHGQTIFHQPEAVDIAGHPVISTLQIGDIGMIAERTGVMTVGDFRTRDMAAGGQGAPLVPYADDLLFRVEGLGRVLVNIGGIANITVLPPKEMKADAIAFDTGPGNMMVDAFTNWATDGKQLFDNNGAIAASGKIDAHWLQELMTHEYFELPPPKSTGRELFGVDYAWKLWNKANHLSNEDRVATITELTAKTIAVDISKYVETHMIKEVFISGGGFHNGFLVGRIKAHLPSGIKVGGTDELGMSGDAKEAMVFALLGYQCYRKRVNNLPSATGAKSAVVMGKIAW